MTQAEKSLKEYIRRDFYNSNIDKYRKYFDDWYNNLTDIQLYYWKKTYERRNLLVMTQEEKEDIIKEFTEKMIEDMVDIPEEIQEIIDEHFFELL